VGKSPCDKANEIIIEQGREVAELKAEVERLNNHLTEINDGMWVKSSEHHKIVGGLQANVERLREENKALWQIQYGCDEYKGFRRPEGEEYQPAHGT